MALAVQWGFDLLERRFLGAGRNGRDGGPT